MSPISTRSLYLSLSVIILLLIASIIITNQFAQSRTIKRTVEPPPVVVQETRLIAYSPDKETAIFVSTKGTSSGDGSQERPLDLNTVLTRQVRPGTTIWIRGGVYVGSFMSYLTGTASKAITVSGYSGERATIDGSLTIYGSFTTFSNLEVTNSSLNRNVPRATGVDVYGPGTKLINNMIHDTGNGIGLWSQALNAEVYGNIIFNCGMNVSGYAHGIYVQNAQGSKLIKDNIIFNNFGYGIHAYGERGSIKNIRFEGNISFNNGVLNAERHFEPNIF